MSEFVLFIGLLAFIGAAFVLSHLIAEFFKGLKK